MWSKLWATLGGDGAGFGVCVYKYFALIITILTETVINICQAIHFPCTQMFNRPVHSVPFNSMAFMFAKFHTVMCFCSPKEFSALINKILKIFFVDSTLIRVICIGHFLLEE